MDSVTRRSFVATVGGIVATSFFVPPAGLAEETRTPSEHGQKAKGQGTIEVSPVEDLMREHGILSRCLLIYEEMIARMEKDKKYTPDPLVETAVLVRRFIEEYHEKLEEVHIFPRFVKAGKLADLVKILQEQHQAGRRLTEQILKSAASHGMEDRGKREQLSQSLRLFARMYRPHKALEDTVLFPALHSIVSPEEYDSLGETFEEKEQELFGENGFEKIVSDVAGIEKKLGIYEIVQFTP